MERITNLEVVEFLDDFKDKSETVILEQSSKEANELAKIAKTRGYDIKGSRDLALFKTVYAFTDQPNSNGAILPKKELLRVLPQIVGKPININHIRHSVVGHYIHYSYKAKENKIIAYGVFYKSNFSELWEEAKVLFKQKRLSTSFEIWSPENKRKKRSDGNYELHQMELAGGALIYEDKDNEPAFKDAKVLTIAKNFKFKNQPELVYASKYKEEEIITGSEALVKIKCSNCNEEFETGELANIKCPKCQAILNKEGQMIYPPQIKDFKVLCPACQNNNWLILSKKDEEAKLRCLGCSKEYDIKFKIKSEHTAANALNFIYTSRVSCPQCGYNNQVAGISGMTESHVKCKSCGLNFKFDIKHKKYKTIAEIKESQKINVEEPKQKEEIKAKKSSEKGGQTMAGKKVEKASENKLEVSKYHRTVDDFEALEKSLEKIDELEEAEKSKRLTYKERKALPDNQFAVVVRVKDKRTGKLRKIRKYPINDKAHVRNALARLAQPAAQATLKKLGVSVESVKKKVLKRAKELKMTDLLERQKASVECSCVECGAKLTTEEHCASLKCPKCGGKMRRADRPGDGKPEEKAKEKVEAKETPKAEEKVETVEKSKYDNMIKKAIDKLRNSRKDLRTAKTEIEALKKQVELYKANAKKIIERREELGDYSDNLTDEQILNEDKFELAKAKKENLELRAAKKNDDDVVGDKAVLEKSEDYYAKKRKAVDDAAFGHLRNK